MKKSYKLLKKITGISCPFFGISWNPRKSDREKIKRVITFLEDRRVLFNPYHLEIPIWVSQSIIEIRAELTKIIPEFDEDSEIVEFLRTMRAACRRYLDRTFKLQDRRFMNDLLIENLIELRSVFGICIAKLSMMYGIDIEEELAEIIPLLNDDDGKKYRLDKRSYKLLDQ